MMPKKRSQPFSHYDAQGGARMVDVSSKARTAREAEASAFVLMKLEVLRALPENPKGDPLEVARTAGIMAAKRTAELIPMCHAVALSHIAVTLRVCENGVSINTKVKTTAETGVEMEALVAASVAALTVYDMCKALTRASKSGKWCWNGSRAARAETTGDGRSENSFPFFPVFLIYGEQRQNPAGG